MLMFMAVADPVVVRVSVEVFMVMTRMVVVSTGMAVLMIIGNRLLRRMRMLVSGVFLDPVENPMMALVHIPASKLEMPSGVVAR
jgi:hypothetical protein